MRLEILRVGWGGVRWVGGGIKVRVGGTHNHEWLGPVSVLGEIGRGFACALQLDCSHVISPAPTANTCTKSNTIRIFISDLATISEIEFTVLNPSKYKI